MITVETFQSKFGFHPCSLETSKKLRTLNRVYSKALSLEATHERWINKEPQNRIQRRKLKDSNGRRIGTEVISDKFGKPLLKPEPKQCNLFSWTFKYPNRKPTEEKPNPNNRPYRISKVGELILEASRQARTPQLTPEAVRPLPISEQEINRLYDLAVLWENC